MPRAGLASMLEARSVAVVGASARPGSFGQRLMIELLEGGFTGDVYPVNPRYGEVDGRACFPTLADLPQAVDLVLLGVPNPRLEEMLGSAADAGASSAVIFASCFEDTPPGRPSLTERLATIADGSRMRVCGGNCMGFLNLTHKLRACGFAMPMELEPGGVTFISHSGSAFSAMLYNRRGLRFNLVVSSGQEIADGAADYLDYALDQPETRAVGMFLETVRDPDRFRKGLERAAENDMPVVILKVGREAAARTLVAAHSGALAGEDGAYEALFDAYAVARVDSLDEMADTLELFTSGRRAAPGRLAALHDSGGERAMLVDAAAEVGVEFAPLSPATTARLAAVLEEGLPAVNPLDAWGTGNDYESIFTECGRALLEDDEVAALAFCVDLTTEVEGEGGYVEVAERCSSEANKPVAVLANLASAIDPGDAKTLRAAGVPVLEGTRTGLRALKHLLGYRDRRARPPARLEGGPPDTRRSWEAPFRKGSPFSEAEALALLADYGVPVVRAEPASSLDAAVARAEAIGWPVALKTAGPGIAHKSDVGGVYLGLLDEDDLTGAYGALASRLGPDVVVESMAPVDMSIELALGIVRDPQFGPLIMVAAGGVLVEILADRRFALPPLDKPRAEALLEGLKIRRLLSEVRGRPAADLDAIEDALVCISRLAVDLGEDLDALDVNPLLVGPKGCVAVDALVLPRTRFQGTEPDPAQDGHSV